MRSKIIALTTAIVASNLLLAQQPGIFGDPNKPEPRASSVPDPQAGVRMPGQAIVKYERGTAPFYVNLKSYVYRAESVVRRGQLNLLQEEGQKLGISRDEFENLVLSLAVYRNREKADWHDHIVAACEPYFGDPNVSNEAALQAIALLDDSDSRRGALVEQTLSEAEAIFGSAVINRLRERLAEYGETVEYEKVDLVKYIEHRGGGLGAKGFLKAECDAL